jgi:hypothetical protein
MAVNRSSATQKAKFQAEMQAYANSKGVTIPPNLINLYGMMPPGYAASHEINARSYYANLAQGRPSFKTPQWAVDNYIKDKPAFYGLVLQDVAATYMGQGANRNNAFLETYIKLAAENGVPVNKTAEIISNASSEHNRLLSEFNARNSNKGFASIGPINLTGVGDAINSVFGGLGTVVENAYKGVSNELAKVEDVVKEEILPSPIFQIAMAYYMPGLVAQFGPSLGALGITSAAAQTAVANAIASTAIQVAQGVPFDKAFQNAVTNAVVSSGSPAIAQDINRVIQNPAVTNAIVSAGASAAKTALNGGSQSDIERNLVAGLVGSGTATATGSNIAGSAAAGGVTGGVTGALTGAASAYGAQVEAERLAKENAAKKASGTSADPGIKVAGGDDSTALNMASISAKPEMLGKSGETASALTSRVDEGVTIYERTITGKTPDGKEYSYIVTYDPSAPSDKQISYTSSGVVKDAEGNVIPSGGGGASSSFKRPDFTAAATTGTYTPTIITPDGTISTGGAGGTTGTGAVSTPVTPTPISPDQPILDFLNQPVIDTTSSAGTGAGVGTDTTTTLPSGSTGSTGGGTSTTTTGGESTSTGTGTSTDVGTGTGSGTFGSGAGDGDGSGAGGTGTGGEGDGIGDGEEESPPADDKGKPYRPNLFIYGGTKPSTLTQTLRTNLPTASTTTGTSVGLGGRGEIESKESGKKRQSVWNEESLRLKDALGL